MRQLFLPPIVLVIALGAMLALHQWWPGSQVVPGPWRAVGLPLLVGGLGLAAWHARLFRRVGTEINTFGEPRTLVCGGLYRFSRNPMYLGFVLCLAGAALLLGTVTPVAVLLAYALLTDRWYIRFEERALLARFGEDYRAYQREVRRWL